MASSNPWDAAPFPAKGEATEVPLFTAVGTALTEWEAFEGRLSTIFGMLLVGRQTTNLSAATHVYGQIVTFRGRADMVKAAIDAYELANPGAQLAADLRALLKLAMNLAPRRNEIAHGVVAPYYSPAAMDNIIANSGMWQEPDGFALKPATYNAGKHTIVGLARGGDTVIAHRNKYAYLSTDVLRYRDEFTNLREEAARIYVTLASEFLPQQPSSP